VDDQSGKFTPTNLDNLGTKLTNLDVKIVFVEVLAKHTSLRNGASKEFMQILSSFICTFPDRNGFPSHAQI
jgi:hypothetical protein